MESLRQAFPAHPELFSGFPRFPFAARDVPEVWRDRWGNGWAEDILEMAMRLEDIESHLDAFPTEGDLGMYIQCGGMLEVPRSIHGALHFKWAIKDSPHSLGSQPVNIENYMFWKLHGWIDGIWQRYRHAKGVTEDNAAYRDELLRQCQEMHDLAELLDAHPPGEDPSLPAEAGDFHERIRPIFESHVYKCSICHGVYGPQANLSLGGMISSSDIVAKLVDQPSYRGGQFMLVVPGDPDRSWLYLKVADLAESAGCVGSRCNTQIMP